VLSINIHHKKTSWLAYRCPCKNEPTMFGFMSFIIGIASKHEVNGSITPT
jgi:hypothetical protein